MYRKRGTSYKKYKKGLLDWICIKEKRGIGNMMQLTEQGTIDNLKDAGCDEKTIHDFMFAFKQGDKKREQRILEKHRESLISTLNAAKKHIDCLDYLTYQMEKNRKEIMDRKEESI